MSDIRFDYQQQQNEQEEQEMVEMDREAARIRRRRNLVASLYLNQLSLIIKTKEKKWDDTRKVAE